MLCKSRISANDIMTAMNRIREAQSLDNVRILSDGTFDAGIFRYIDCRLGSEKALEGIDIPNTTFIYACDQDDIGKPIIANIIARGGRFIPVWVHEPASYMQKDHIARSMLEDEFVSQSNAGFAKFDWGPADFANICQALYITRNISGAYFEVGCFRGSSSAVALRYMREQGIYRDSYFLDVFSGFDYEEAQKSSDAIWTGTHATEGREAVEKRLRSYVDDEKQNVSVIKSNIITDDIPDSVQEIAVANLDVDMYEAVVAGLNKISSKIVKGGIIIVEDPGHTPLLIGSEVAVSEFCASRQGKNFMPIYMASGQYFLVRTQ